MSEIKFLNIDLDIESQGDISLVVKEFCNRLTVMRNDCSKGMYYASFETGYTEENIIIEEYVNIIEGLSPEAREIWNNCLKREFDFGYESGDKPNDFHSKISAKSIELLAKVGGSFTVTIYPPFKNESTLPGLTLDSGADAPMQVKAVVGRLIEDPRNDDH